MFGQHHRNVAEDVVRESFVEARTHWSDKEQLKEHLEQVIIYIEDLMQTEKLISAQPLKEQSVMITGTKGRVKDGPFNESKELIVGYYLIHARDMQEGVDIGKRNPNFHLNTQTSIEVRPIRILGGVNHGLRHKSARLKK